MDAEQIVRALADAPNPVEGDFGLCMLCEAEFRRRDYEGQADPEHHSPTCPWRMAREWVAERSLNR